jgi:Uma2 family endonuclease
MSTATAIPTTIRPAHPGWVPSPLYRMTVEQYEAMVASGVFSRKYRLHLINGYLVAKTTQNPPHWVADELCGAELARIIPADRYLITAAKPIRLPNQASKPEPDRCVVRGTIRDYERHNPGPDDIVLLVEVADSSLADDRELAIEVYGPAGIPVYWIVNLVHRQVEVFSDPGPESYRSSAVFLEGQSVPFVVDGQALGQVAVADLLPSRPAGPRAEGNGT